MNLNNLSLNKVLIVDDEPSIRVVLGEALRGWGYDTVEAETGARALSTLATARPEAVLLDINLPDSSGLDLLREIKKREPQTVVIMATAETMFENAIAALRGGATDFIGKPFNLGELRFALDQALGLKRQGLEPPGVCRPSVLIISDTAERIPNWQATFDPREAEISCVLFPEEWEYVSHESHDLAVVDVGAAFLETVLKNLRASKEHADIPVLVEIGRASAASGMGILPRYRAMPCSDNELIRLARRRINSITGHDQARALL